MLQCIIKEFERLQPKHRMADSEPTVCVLPPAEVEALLTELQVLLSTLLTLLPLVVPTESSYGALIGFMPNLELVDNIGKVGTINTALEHMFGHRKNQLKIAKRGKSIESIMTVLERYLKKFPSDIILQEWLIDFVSNA